MKKNIYGIIITIISFINILFMIFYYCIYDLGLKNNIYMIGGTIISIGLLILLFKNNIYGYIGTTIFYGIQIFVTKLIFGNFRYGFILHSEFNASLNSLNHPQVGFNFTAIFLVIMGILGYIRHKKLMKLESNRKTIS